MSRKKKERKKLKENKRKRNKKKNFMSKGHNTERKEINDSTVLNFPISFSVH